MPQCPNRGMRGSNVVRTWTLGDLDWAGLDAERARGDPLLYYLVASASFVESAADRYTANLLHHFSDPALRGWLVEHWEAEELQHGRALRRYVETVWAELDWPRAYEAFLSEYSLLATVEALEPEPALELVARCVVEMGTATFYTALHRRAEDPLLKQLVGLIRQDEVRHYTRFRQSLEAERSRAGIRRAAVLRALGRRLAQVKSEDAYVGFKHAWRMRHPRDSFDHDRFDRFRAELRGLVRRYYPYRMALQMLLQPLDLNHRLVRIALPLLERGARLAL